MIACFNLCISVLSGLSGLSVCVCVFMVFPCLLFICQFVCLDWRNKDIYSIQTIVIIIDLLSTMSRERLTLGPCANVNQQQPEAKLNYFSIANYIGKIKRKFYFTKLRMANHKLSRHNNCGRRAAGTVLLTAAERRAAGAPALSSKWG